MDWEERRRWFWDWEMVAGMFLWSERVCLYR